MKGEIINKIGQNNKTIAMNIFTLNAVSPYTSCHLFTSTYQIKNVINRYELTRIMYYFFIYKNNLANFLR